MAAWVAMGVEQQGFSWLAPEARGRSCRVEGQGVKVAWQPEAESPWGYLFAAKPGGELPLPMVEGEIRTPEAVPLTCPAVVREEQERRAGADWSCPPPEVGQAARVVTDRASGSAARSAR